MSNQGRVLWIVLDSLGIGELPDAGDYGDAGSATLQHIAEAVSGIALPNMARLGLGHIAPIQGVAPVQDPTGAWGKCAERSPGKDTTTGHWEMSGRILAEPFALFPEGFPPAIVDAFTAATGIPSCTSHTRTRRRTRRGQARSCRAKPSGSTRRAAGSTVRDLPGETSTSRTGSRPRTPGRASFRGRT